MKEAFSKNRRVILKSTALTGVSVYLGRAAAQVGATSTATAGAASSITAGDILVYQSGPKKGKPIKSADVTPDAPVLAYAMDPKTKKLRDQVKASIVLVKVSGTDLSSDSKANAADNVVAYSSICTHQGCPVSQLGSLGTAQGKLECPCHHSVFDPADNAKVLDGPAPRRLPALPLKAASGQLVAAGPLTGRVGPGK